MALRPYSPNERVEPRHALPVIRPRCCLRYLTFLGINMDYSLPPSPPGFTSGLSVSGLASSGFSLSFQLKCVGGAIGGKIGADVRVVRSSGVACVTGPCGALTC